VFSVAIKFAVFLRKHPLIPVALTVAWAVVGAFFGHHAGHNNGRGLWDGPV
jgi:hypothetical protein